MKMRLSIYIFLIFLLAAINILSQELKYEQRDIVRQVGDKSDSSLCCYQFSYEYPVVTRFGENWRKDSLNGIIMSIRDSVFPKSPEGYVENQIEQFRSFRKDFPEARARWFEMYTLKADTVLHDIMALTYGSYSYFGGAHPVYTTEYFNIDLANLLLIEFEDILTSKNVLDSLGELQLKKKHNLEADQPLDSAGFFIDKNGISLNDNFLITDSGLVFLFNPYEIGPWVLGYSAVFFGFDEITPFINRSGRLGYLNRKPGD